ncbi:unnamed protein product [Sphagnum balticum]
MYGASGAACTVRPNTGVDQMASFPSSSPLSSLYSSWMLCYPCPAAPPPVFSEFRQSRIHLQYTVTRSSKPNVSSSSSPGGCAAVWPLSQLSISNGPNSRLNSSLPCLQPAAFSRQQTFQQPRLLRRLPIMQATRHERVEGTHKRPVLCRVVNADADQVNGGEIPLEVYESPEGEDSSQSIFLNPPPYQPPQKGQLRNRVVFGLLIGLTALGVVLAGGWVFTVIVAAIIWVATGEYFDLVQSKGITQGMPPPPPVATKVCSAICSAMPLMTLYFGGRVGVAVTTASFLLATVLLLQQGPRFSQLSSAIFGLFYCGYLPCFWIKLRCGLAVPAINTKLAASWPVLLGGQAQWTVGLLATIIAISTIIAADTGAFLGGRALGRTPLNEVSPKKTLEGAAVGLSSAVTVAVVLAHLLQWPLSLTSAAALAILVFMGSLFGDLTESMIKRDAGVKDSGKLIPGHGGILDRVDSYVFTGALVYSFVKIGLPLFGV